MAVEFDPYYKWLGILPKDQPPHHYRLLGIEVFEDDLQVIEAAADRQLSFLRKYQSGEYASQCQKLLNEISRARLCLLKPTTKSAYDATLRRQLEPDDPFGDIIDDVSEDALPQPRKKGRSGSAKKSAAGNEFLIPAAVGGGLLLLAMSLFFVFRRGRPEQPVVPVPDHAAPAIAAPAHPDTPVVREKGIKSPVESPVVSSPAQNTTRVPSAQTTNLLPLLKPEHQVVGPWKIAPDRLETVGFHLARQIRLPVDPPPAGYTIHLRATRHETPDAPETLLGLVTVYGDRRTLVIIDVGIQRVAAGIHAVDDLRWDINQTSLHGYQTEIGRPFDFDVIVRHDGIEARVDGRTIIDFKGDPRQVSLSPDWAASPPGQLTLAAESQYTITELTIGPPLPRHVQPGADLRPGQSLELLPLVDLQKDVWAPPVSRVGTTLKTDPKIFCCRFSVPFAVPEEYELVADLESNLPFGEAFLGFPVQEGHGGMTLGSGSGLQNFLWVDRRIDHWLRDRHVEGAQFSKKRSKISVVVRKSRLTVQAEGRPVFEWRGDPRRLICSNDWVTPGNLISFGSNNVEYQIHSLKLTRLQPDPTPPFPPVPMPVDGDLLKIVHVDRDTAKGFWRQNNGVLWCSGRVVNALRFPATLPANYEFRIQAQRPEGASGLLEISLPINGQSVMVAIDGEQGKSGGVEFFHNARYDKNPAVVRYPSFKLPVDKTAVIQGRVQGTHLHLDIDGTPFLDLDLPDKLTDSSWEMRPGWFTPEERLHLVLTTNCEFNFPEVRFRTLEANSPAFPAIDLSPNKAP